MSETLTEKWKNGTLKEGWYYLSIVPSKKCIDYFIGQDFERYNEWAIEEVLAPVPTYEEWEEIQESNDGLSKLMFKSLMNRFVKADEERERLEEQLDIATKALKEYADEENWSTATTEINTDYFTFEYSMYGLEHNGFIDAQKALKEIDEVKND